TSGSAPTPTATCPTPSASESFCCRIDEAASYICPRSTVSEVRARIITGASAGFTFRYVGLFGNPAGKNARAALIAACTSRAAPSMSRLKSNCRTMLVEPRLLEDVISVTPAIRANCRSSGVATDDAIVSGLAPGNAADTWIVGNSTSGKGETGRTVYASAPANATATVNKDVATGR